MPITPEDRARQSIDRLLAAAGWVVQDRGDANITVGRGAAVCKFPMKKGHGEADYLLFVDGAAAGAIEAKKEGKTLTQVEIQTAKYSEGVPEDVPAPRRPLPFLYESTGIETRFTNLLEPDARSRQVFAFHRPETLADSLDDELKHPGSTLRAKLRQMPMLAEERLWPAQVKAINNLEASLAAMNLYLHSIGGDDCLITVADSLNQKPSTTYDMVLTNPPFGKKSSITVINEEGEEARESLIVVREDFWASTSNKQLNFLQHVKSCLKIHGRAAIVVPDNVLFEGGAGETIRRKLLHECDVHTLLRLPTGIFYAQGVKANVFFFDRKPASEKPWTTKLWIYDFRTNQHFTLKTNPLKRADLDDFVKCYNPENRHARKETERFHVFSYDDLIKRDKVSLDIFWMKDESLEDSANLPDPGMIAAEIAEDLQAALDQFATIASDLKK